MLELMYGTGLRVSELVNLKLSDVDLNEEIVRTFGKGSKERVVPIGEFASESLRIYINNINCNDFFQSFDSFTNLIVLFYLW